MLRTARALTATAVLALTLTGCGSATVIDTTKPETIGTTKTPTPGDAVDDGVPGTCTQFVRAARDLTTLAAKMSADLSEYPRLVSPVLQAALNGDQATAQQLTTTYQAAVSTSTELGNQVAQFTGNLTSFGDSCKTEPAASAECRAAVDAAYAMRKAYNGTLPELVKYTDLVVAAATAGESRDQAKTDAVVAEMSRIGDAVKKNAPVLADALAKSNAALEACSPAA
jgi:DNA repair ATPase RecN